MCTLNRSGKNKYKPIMGNKSKNVIYDGTCATTADLVIENHSVQKVEEFYRLISTGLNDRLKCSVLMKQGNLV